jgi:hypothetical protein
VVVEVYLRREGLPSDTQYDCFFPNIRELDWDYQDEVALAKYCKSPLPSLAGNWIVSIRTPKAVGYAFEAFLEPNYARTTESTITIGAATANIVSSALTITLAVVCMIMML